uniref:Uncharacterized protein n=1 Tax=viral metagenome TaxID=1070528 RepID=A0A6C0JW91_9ZZZZ
MSVYNSDEVKIVGNNHVVNGDRCQVDGNNCVVNGDRCEVQGNNNVINGDRCKVQGNNHVINGDHTELYGNNCIINGDNTIDNGKNNTKKSPKRSVFTNYDNSVISSGGTMNIFGGIRICNGYPVSKDVGRFNSMVCTGDNVFVDGEKLVLRNNEWSKP